MATVTYTLTDQPDGNVGVSINFDPPFQSKAAETPAHRLAGAILSAIRDTSEVEFHQEGDEGLVVTEAQGGHGGPGLYAHDAEYPEEGSIFLAPVTSKSLPPRRIRLHVEDRGQDCTWFDIEDGVIVDCLFQQNIWTKRPVAPERVLTGAGGDCNDWRVGDMIGFVDDCATLNYPVIKVEHRPQPEEKADV